MMQRMIMNILDNPRIFSNTPVYELVLTVPSTHHQWAFSGPYQCIDLPSLIVHSKAADDLTVLLQDLLHFSINHR